MTRSALPSILAALAVAGCTNLRDDASGSTFTRQFAQAPQAAAACFARNARAHSSALVAEVRAPDARGRVQVVVSVKNGVHYATAELRPAGTRAEGTIRLDVVSRNGNRQLVDMLVEGC